MSGSESLLSRLVNSKKAEFTGVIEYFFDKRNEDSGLYGQALFRIVIDNSQVKKLLASSELGCTFGSINI